MKPLNFLLLCRNQFQKYIFRTHRPPVCAGSFESARIALLLTLLLCFSIIFISFRIISQLEISKCLSPTSRMRGVLKPLLTSERPILCLSLNPPLFKTDQESLGSCAECQSLRCICSAKAALIEAFMLALKTAPFGAVKLDTAYYEQFGPAGFKVCVPLLRKMCL